MRRGRVTAELSPTQQDLETFTRIQETIRKISVQALADYCQASHTTIYDYARRKPVSEKSEEQILAGIKAYQKAKLERGEKRLELAKQLIQDATSC
ncbi:hypothetical protein WBJ53_26295 [Spirosoma sp. SC4-14]|uniref:hypothetical protein n=1 Tax=Spirosoma sp. SC4-14 TaxID=3128900 RepID=UPI0030D5324B